MNIFLNNSIFLLTFIFNSCMQVDDIKKNLLSGDRDSIIESAKWIKEHEIKDTSIVIQLLTHILDPRVSTSAMYYRETPYLARLDALEKITGLKPSYKIDRKLNALIVDYYLNWAVNKKYIRTKDDINVIPPYIKQISDSKSFMKLILNSEQVTWLSKYSWESPPFNDDKFHN